MSDAASLMRRTASLRYHFISHECGYNKSFRKAVSKAELNLVESHDYEFSQMMFNTPESLAENSLVGIVISSGDNSQADCAGLR